MCKQAMTFVGPPADRLPVHCTYSTYVLQSDVEQSDVENHEEGANGKGGTTTQTRNAREHVLYGT